MGVTGKSYTNKKTKNINAETTAKNRKEKTMKKNLRKIASSALSILLVFSFSVVGLAAEISVQQAKEIALKDAGYKASDVAYIKAEADYERGVKEYEIEFLVKGEEICYEFDYEVRAADGKILSKEREAERVKAQPKVEVKQQPKAEEKVQPKAEEKAPAKAVESAVVDIGKEAAIQAAYEAFGVNAQEVKLIKAVKDYDDAVAVYEVEFAKGYECKYSCEVIAASGKVVDKEKDVSRSFFDKAELFFEVIFAQCFEK